MSRAALAREIIDKIVYLTLATADKRGMPWCTPVYTAFNDRYEFFWASGIDTRHSCNIRENPRTGATIYDSTLPEGQGEAVYMEGQAVELTPENWQEGVACLRARAHRADDYYPLAQFETAGPVRIYKFTPENFFMLNPEGDSRYGVYADCRQEIDIFGD